MTSLSVISMIRKNVMLAIWRITISSIRAMMNTTKRQDVVKHRAFGAAGRAIDLDTQQNQTQHQQNITTPKRQYPLPDSSGKLNCTASSQSVR
jgi:hypothetical protein